MSTAAGPERLERLAACRRILVLGPSGSGKTVLSLRLGELLDLPVLHLDRLFWRPGFVRTPEAEWRARLRELVAEPAWIMDGNYEASLDLRVPAAEACIYLDCGRLRSLAGVVRRHLAHRGTERVDAPAGQRLDLPFLRYVWRFPVTTRPFVLQELERLGEGKEILHLAGRRAAARLLAGLA